MVIDNSKPMRPAVCSGEERELISRTAAGNRAYIVMWIVSTIANIMDIRIEY